ncbi:hypothetical protein [Crateriforma conspicua]|uniref:Uncharacterized protein n=1 Tax=Crateriforma conspicua TaxID=2527996 RepID=A0A5C6FU88_9PLAN|nr:hypothetical protein [Crateriforma conspicua]TWU66469.1 hypothetical protein V7x_20350 [Crateriforma conspicua]
MTSYRDLDADRSLLHEIESREAADAETRNEIHARCVLVERACDAMGYAVDGSHGRILRLIARVAGFGLLTRQVMQIANDPDVSLSRRQTNRAIEDLVQDGLIVAAQREVRKPRGRPVKLRELSLDRDGIQNRINGQDEVRTRCESRPESFCASERHRTGIEAASGGHQGGIGPASERHDDTHSLYPPLLPSIPGPPSSRKRATVEAGSVEDGEDLLNEKVGKEHRGGGTRAVTTTERLEPTVRRLARSLRWPPGDAQTLWRVAAAFDAGLVSEADVADACRATALCSRGSPIGYFRRVLAERLELDADGMKRLLSTVRCIDRFPNQLPSRRERAESATLPSAVTRPPPSGVTERQTEQARQRVLRDLAAMTDR